MMTLTDALATSTDAFTTGTSTMATFNDMYILLFVIGLFMLAFFARNMFRKMFINMRGGRKDD